MLHTIASLQSETGGPAKSVPGLVESLAKQGVDVALWCQDATGAVPVSVPLFDGPFELALRQKEYDLVHDHGVWLPCNHFVATTCAKWNIPRVVSPRGMLEPWAMNHRKWKKRVAWWLYQRNDLQKCAALHATAPSEAEQFKKLGLHQEISVIPNGVNLAQIPEVRSEGSSEHRTVLFLSRIHPKKGLQNWIRAWQSVCPEGWRMRVVGPDQLGHRSELEQVVEAVGLDSQWRFEGMLEGEAKWEALTQADLFVLPSYSENFGIVVAEALACGTPVITTTGTPWNELQSRGCGWWVEPDSESLESVLVEAIALNDSERLRMGERGRSWVRDEFSWSGIAEKMVNAYDEIDFG